MLWALGEEVADTFEMSNVTAYLSISWTLLDGGKKCYIAGGHKKSDTSFDIHSLIAYSDDEGQTWTINKVGAQKVVSTG